MSEVMVQGLQVTLYGLATVFASLVLFAGMVKLMQATMGRGARQAARREEDEM